MLSISGALIARMIECDLDLTCIAERDSDLMTEYYECFTGSLTAEEEVWSERIIRAWTNFAATG